MEPSIPITPSLIPRRLRLIPAILLLAAGVGLACYSVLCLCDLIGMCSPDFVAHKGISLKPFVNPQFPDHFPWVYYQSSARPYYLLLGAMGLFALGLLLVPDLTNRRKADLPWQTELVLLGVICLMAIVMRFYKGDELPYGLHYDESTNAMIGRDFIQEWKPEVQVHIQDLRQKVADADQKVDAKTSEFKKTIDGAEKQRLQGEVNRLKGELDSLRRQIESIEVPVFTNQGFGKATAHMYQIALSMKWLGTSILSIRLPTMIAGVLGVLALYLLLRWLSDAPTALLGATFLAAFRWHVNFSRVAYDAIEAPLIITVTALFFFLAFKSKDEYPVPPQEGSGGGGLRSTWKQWVWHILKTTPIWLIAGYCFGLSVYSYKPLYLFPGVLACFLAIRWLMQRQMLRWNLVGLVLFLLAAYFCAKEMLDFRRNHPEVFAERLNMVSIVNLDEPWRANWQRIWENLQLTLRMFHIRGDVNPRHNHSLAPMVNPIPGVLFPLGLVWALVRWRSRLGLFSLGWFTAMLLPMVLSIEAPNTLRAICIIPVICIWSAVALRMVGIAFLTLAEDWLPGRRWLSEPLRWMGWVFVVMIVGCFWWGEYHLYFRDQLPKKEPYIHFDAKFVNMAKFVNTQQGKFYAVSDANGHNSLKLLNKEGIWRNHLFLQQELPAHGAPEEDALYIVMEPRDRPDKMVWIEWLYGPEVTGTDAKDPWGGTIFRWYRVPSEIKLKHRGFSIEMAGSDKGEPFKAAVTQPVLTFNPADLTLPSPVEVKGKAMWVIPEGRQGGYRFRVETPDRFTLWIDSEKIFDASPGTAPAEVAKDLFAGAHQVEFVFATQNFKDLTRVMHIPPGGGDWQELGGEQFHDRGMLPQGLRMIYWFGGRKWEGQPEYVWVDPFINYRWNPPYKFPMSMEWKGFLDCPTTGNYSIGNEAWDYSLIEIDGQKLVETPGGKEQKNRYLQGAIQLTQGKHAIRILYSDTIGGGEALRLYWQVPGKTREIIPNAVLSY
jgi:4-amino-4-deoxy-L-arabinose transferase-like glycosyltransferase